MTGLKMTIACGVAGAGLCALAVCDRPDLSELTGTAYHTHNWFSMGTSIHSETKATLFDNITDFILSPRYPAPIRKIVLTTRTTAKTPSRYLRVCPFVAGVEAGTNDFFCAATNCSPEMEDVVFDFPLSARVDAFRICLGGSGTGNWIVSSNLVLYGEQTADEEALLRAYARELPAPVGLAVDDFSASSLSLTASAVEGASGYLFEVSRLEGCPQTVLREDFVSAPEVGEGWTLARAENVTLGQYMSTTYPDTKTAEGGEFALQIAAASKPQGPHLVQIVSTVVSAAVTETSYVCKRAPGEGNTDRITVYGRSSEKADWQVLNGPSNVPTSKVWVTNAVPAELDVRQVMFEFAAETGHVSNCGLDTLRVVYGGNEKTVPAATNACAETPPFTVFNGLAKGRYAYRVKAVGNESCRDSSWSEAGQIDLAWADIRVEAPTEVACSVKGDALTVSWRPVAGADHYLVDVVSADDPDHPVLRGGKVSGTSLTLTVPGLGEYSIRVTAVAPGGKTSAAAEPIAGNVQLGPLGAVTAEAIDRQTIVATWKAIPLAESYQAKLIRIGGTARVDRPDFSGLPETWPEGWSKYIHDDESYAGPVPKMQFQQSWIETGVYTEPVTEIVCKFKSNAAAKWAEELGRAILLIEGTTATSGTSEWQELARHPLSASMQTFADAVAWQKGMRKLRFRIGNVGDAFHPDFKPMVELNVQSVTYGQVVRSEEASVATEAVEVTFDDLDPAGCYQVEVTPQPSEGGALASVSAPIDLADEKFRTLGAVPLSGLKGGAYEENFDSLSTVGGETEARKLDLDFWQFCKGSGEAKRLLYTAGTNATGGGVYVFSDAERTTASFCLGTLATSSSGCMIGIAFKNDLDYAIAVETLSFETIQRNFKAKPSDYHLEWRMTDGETSVLAGDDWQELEIGPTAPYTAETQAGRAEYRQAVKLPENPFGRKLSAGGVLVLRWRHDKVSSGPMMAIDDVRLEFPAMRKGFGVILR